jgi:glycosyltransferase involved in cell wall biosynthesis
MKQQHFTIIITAYNCEKWIRKCMESAICQEYENYDIIVIDAGSTDGTNAIIHELQKSDLIKAQSVTCIQNTDRCYQTENILKAVKLAEPGSICVSLDGDDWLTDNEVLPALNRAYNSAIWLTYGRYKHDDGSFIAGDAHHRYPDSVIQENSYREYPKQLFTHLRTWRRELFLKIDEADLRVKPSNRFAWNSGDCFIGYPMLEMAGQRQLFIDRYMYVYNVNNPLSDCRVAASEQVQLANYAKGLRRYQKLESLWMPS